jgi:hypothetical protein
MRILDASSCFTTVCSAAFLVSVAACGVSEHPHDQPPIDPSGDFGTPTTTGTGGGAGGSTTTGAGGSASTTSGGSAGTSSAGGAAGSGTTGSGAGGSGVAGSGNGGSAGTGNTAGAGGGTGGSGAADASAPPGRPDAAAPPARDAAPPPPSGGGLTLGGTLVPKENILAFIHIGHSNNAGRATTPAASRAYHQTQVDPFAWTYHPGMPPRSALEPFTAGDGVGNQYGGPGTALMKQAAAMAPGKYALSLGFGQGSAYCSQFLPGALYYDSLIAGPKAVKGNVTFAAIVILLGITERHGTATDIAEYPNCINKLVTAIRTDVGVPDLPLLITDYEVLATGTLAIDQPFGVQMAPQIRKVPGVVMNSALVTTEGLAMQDDHHFNFDGHKTWTARLLQVMKTKGWAPWATQ